MATKTNYGILFRLNEKLIIQVVYFSFFLEMTGRGFLKSRMAQLASQKQSEEQPVSEKPLISTVPDDLTKSEEQLKSDEQLKLEEQPKSQDHGVSSVQIPLISDEALVAGRQQVVRGRRVIIII